MERILFICSQNRLRSPTAEHIFSMDERVDVRSAGLDRDAVHTLSSEDLKWADIIFVMEKSHQNKLSKKYREFLKGKKIICLNIPDEYDYMDPLLIRLLKTSVSPYLGTY